MNILTTYSGPRFVKNKRYELFKKIREQGHTLFVLDQEAEEKFVDGDGDVHVPLGEHTTRSNKNPFRELKFIYTLQKIFRDVKIDCIIIYGIKVIPTMVFAAKLAGVKKRVCVVNGAGKLFMNDDFSIKLFRIITFPVLKAALRNSDKVFVQNQDDYEMLIGMKLLPENRACRINGSGVNLEKYPFSALSPGNDFLLITRVVGTKGINEFIEAADAVLERHPSASFHIVGPGDEKDASVDWEKFNSAISRGTITYHGETDDVVSFIKKSRVFVFPSYYREGVPRAVLEAMSMGRPIITTSSPGCRETVEEGINGFLVEPRNHRMLAEKMIWMVEHPEAVEKMGLASRRIAEEKFNIDRVNEFMLSTIGVLE